MHTAPFTANRVSAKRYVTTGVVPRVILVLMCTLFALPFYWMIVTSLKGSAELTVFPPTLWPRDPVWRNYRDAVLFIPFLRFFMNSVILAAGATIGAVLSNAVIAYGFSRIPWKGRDILFYIAIATVFIPFPITLVALFDIFARLGWINTYLPLIVPAFFGNAFHMFLIRQFLMGISHDLSDAARIDGAGELMIFSRIILPLMKPALAVVAIFAAVNAWNDFLSPLIYLQTQELYPLSIGLQFFRAEHNIEFSLLMAASTLVVIPIIVLFIFFQRYFVEGITIGAIKG
ncbi:MAG: carbohydrate ABC transporter permease [Spirochaetales bacterium]|nr:carbohydrate ABC transporter permease [Spirochaetales bacterium]